MLYIHRFSYIAERFAQLKVAVQAVTDGRRE